MEKFAKVEFREK